MLTGLSHGAVSGGNHEDCTVHLCGTGDHVLDVVSVAGCINVSVVTLGGLVLNVRDVDGDTALALFRSGVDRREVADDVDGRRVLFCKNLRNCGGQSGLAVVDVTNRSDVYVRLAPLELGLSHGVLLGLSVIYPELPSKRLLIRNIKFLVYRVSTDVVTRGAQSPLLFWTISSATAFGTSAYVSNVIEYTARPEVFDRKSPTYPNISDSGTRARTTLTPVASSML